MNIGLVLEAEALRILREIPDLVVTTEPPDTTVRPPADAMIRHAGTETPVAIEVKRRCDAATAHRIAHTARKTPEIPLILVARETTATARRVLEDAGIAYVDGLGNAHLELPGLIVRLAARRKPPPKRARSALSGKSGLVAQALLLEPDRKWHVKDVVKAAEVSAGLAHRVLSRLEEAEILEATGTGPSRTRKLARPSALLDLWDEEQTDQPVRTLAYHLAQTPRRLIEGVAEGLAARGIGYAFTGAVGASVVAPFSTSVPVAEIWVDAATSESALLDPPTTAVAEGHNLVFLQERDNGPLAFRANVDGVWVTNLFRLYHDLRQDPRRGPAQAQHLRDEMIGF